MWTERLFKSYAAQEAWITKNEHRYAIDRLYINNGYGVTYKKLIRVY